MRKITLLLSLFIVSFAFGQGMEDFDNLGLQSTHYEDGSFVGNNGVVWNFIHVRNEGDFPIDGAGIMFRRADEPSSLSATIQGGIANFSVDTRKAFTGNSERRLTLLINNDVIAEFTHQFGEGEDDTVVPFEVENIDVSGEFTLEIRVGGADLGNRQIILDNLTWTGHALSIHDNTKQAVSMFPNPAENIVTIQTKNNEMPSIAVFDVLGKQVLTQTGNTFNVNTLKSGVYMVQVTTTSGVSVQKLVVR